MNKTRKKILIFSILTAITVCCVVTSHTTQLRRSIAGKIVRLHILANSDSPSDQKIKLLVRDRLLREGKSIFANAQNPLDCYSLAEENINFLTSAAEDEIKKHGGSDNVKISCGNYFFPMKSYSTFALPAGNYDAVRVEIGSGMGQNWWCVMFPPLCFVNGAAEDGSLSQNLTAEEMDLITAEGGVCVKFKIVDFFEQSVNSIKTALKK